MSEKEILLIIKCPTCGKEMRVKPNIANVYCVKCQKWAKVVPLDNENTGKENDNNPMN